MRELAESILLGPQGEILQAIENYNNRWRPDKPLRCTKTFRWSPGTFDSIAETVIMKVLQFDKKGSVNQVFDRRDNNTWQWDNMKNSIANIEGLLSRQRANGLVFQDNTDLVAEKFSELKERMVQQEELINQFVGDSADYTAIIREGINRTGSDNLMNYEIGWNIIFYQPKVAVYNADRLIAEVPHADVEIEIVTNLVKYVNQLCLRGFDAMSTSQLGFRTSGRYHADNPEPNGEYGRSRFNYQYHSDSLTFPYVGRRHNNHRSDAMVNICLGDYDGLIKDAIAKQDLVAVSTHLQGWMRYNIPGTNPLNNIRLSMFGMPSHYSNEFRNIVGQQHGDCSNRLWWYLGDNELQWNGTGELPSDVDPELYDEKLRRFVNKCTDVQCVLRDTCERHLQITSHIAGISEEENVVIQDIPGQESDEAAANTQEILDEEYETHDRGNNTHLDDMPLPAQGESEDIQEAIEEVVEQTEEVEDGLPDNISGDQDDTNSSSSDISNEEVARRMTAWARTWGQNRIIGGNNEQNEERE